MQQSLLNGSLFKTVCPHCIQELTLQYDLIYEDDENGFTINLVWEKIASPRYNIAYEEKTKNNMHCSGLLIISAINH